MRLADHKERQAENPASRHPPKEQQKLYRALVHRQDYKAVRRESRPAEHNKRDERGAEDGRKAVQ